ncbi:two-component sensor histidine kinase [Nocardiopsis gilva YIM 90087]|uniref:histidine kinase n=1 Tax=Nocardiopsis gilva YIM 90087 TaxID=1235441 RepID=A0A223S7J1_9ACTN|nr:sensor histidine kinase [Nocardiopsis gilva]ASU84095.1 two-component sensor histidine kinase [Nocardiopsis gilva YIM 90087]
MSLRWKITATVTLVSVLVAVALSLTVHLAYAYRLADEARKIQQERIELALREYSRTGQPTLGSRLDPPDLPEQLRAAVEGGYTATLLEDTGDGAYIWAAASVSERQILSLRTPYDPQLSALASLDRVLVMGALTVVALGAGAGVVIGAQLSVRLRRAAVAAGRVADGDRSTRVSAAIGSGSRDEAAELAHAIDAMADALQSRIEAERRVTADIAHELRTPLTGLTTAAELLPPGRPAELVRDRVRVLRALVEDVLEVARLDTATERAEMSEVALGAFTTRRAAPYAPEVEVHVLTDAVVDTDPRRLERILVNLITNALKHGAPPVAVEVDGARIGVRDHGSGFPDELVSEGPSRFRKWPGGSGGHGLGLTIALGQANVLGARLTFANPADGGALATVDLAPDEHPTVPQGEERSRTRP